MPDSTPTPKGRSLGRLAWMFPGQGSQQAGMGVPLLREGRQARLTLEEADDTLGWSLSSLCCRGDAAELIPTQKMQPALLAVSVALLREWAERSPVRPDMCLGHSLGEYSALVAAGVMNFCEALRVVVRRGELMALAVPPGMGGMVAILGAGLAPIERVCREAQGEHGEILVVANYNCPGQIVVSGHSTALERAEPLWRSAGARGVIRLPVSAPFHCALMRPAAEGLAACLKDVLIEPAATPVLSNVTALPHAADPRPALVEQVVSPVRWEDCVRRAYQSGCTTFIEIGPGNVLSGLLRRIAPDARALSVDRPSALDKVEAFLSREGSA